MNNMIIKPSANDVVITKQQAIDFWNLCVPQTELYKEIIRTENSRNKITVNIRTGRFSLKLSEKTSNKIEVDLLNFIDLLMAYESFPSYTLRGKVEWNKHIYGYVWVGCDGNKKAKVKATLTENDFNIKEL